MESKDFIDNKERKRVVVFGIFDGIHEGHRSLFSQARLRSMGSFGGQAKDVELVVIVGRGSSSLRWKDKRPKHSEQERLKLVRVEENVDAAVLGDEEQSSYKILEKLNPDIICLGYDQGALELDLAKWLSQKGKDIPLILLKPHKEDEYHNSFL